MRCIVHECYLTGNIASKRAKDVLHYGTTFGKVPSTRCSVGALQKDFFSLRFIMRFALATHF